MSAEQIGSDVHDSDKDAEVTLCLSGGGTRAALFSLGVMLYLVDSGLNRRVRAISSVSGGSITNAFVAQRCDFGSISPSDFDPVASELITLLVDRGVVSKSWLLRIAVAGWVLGVGLAGAMFLTAWPASIPLWGAIAVVPVAGALMLLRGKLVDWQISKRFFHASDRPRTLGQISSEVQHVFCSTDLGSNAPFFFCSHEGGYVYSPAFGYGQLGDFPLGEVVRASAAFPGAIPPRRLAVGDVKYSFRPLGGRSTWQGFQSRRVVDEDDRFKPGALYLADGGVWNNLGTQVLDHQVLGYERGSWSAPSREAAHRVVVVNASAPVVAQPMRRLAVPIIGDIFSLFRSISVLNFNTVAPRADWLRENGNAVVSITEPHYRALSRVAGYQLAAAFPDDQLIAQLYGADVRVEDWDVFRIHDEDGAEGLTRLCSLLPTTLGRVSLDDALRLLIHGYQNAQTELLVGFGCPRPRQSDIVWYASIQGLAPRPLMGVEKDHPGIKDKTDSSRFTRLYDGPPHVPGLFGAWRFQQQHLSGMVDRHT